MCAQAAFSRANQTDQSEDTSVVEFLDTIEEPLINLHLPEAKGKTIYASLLGTAANMTPVENVKVIYKKSYSQGK